MSLMKRLALEVADELLTLKESSGLASEYGPILIAVGRVPICAERTSEPTLTVT
jgi:hypothetical protein